MSTWIVYTPDYVKHAYGMEPPEYGADVIEVEAETKRDAIALAVRAMLKDWRYRWCRDQRLDGRSPYAEVKVDGPFSEADRIIEERLMQ